ncbi:MAG: acyl-CoA dehydrogenase family protein [Caulobacterales bacterium]
MDMDLNPEDLVFRDEVRAFLFAALPNRLKNGAEQSPGVFVDPDIGLEWQRILHEKGWLASLWPREDGGTGWTPMQRYIFDKECALAGAPALSAIGLKLVGPVICRFGTPEQKARFLPRLLSSEDYWCQGYSEPGAGSDLASLKTRAVRDGDSYVINGAKIWTTHAHFANWIFVLARTSVEAKNQAGISFFLVPMNQAGVTTSPIVTMAGDHEVNSVFFDNARTSAENLIGAEGQGWAIAKFLLENERGASCYAPKLLVDIEKIERAAARLPSGTSGAMSMSHEFAVRLARLKLETRAFEVTELRILDALAKGRAPGPQTSLVKLIGSNLRQKVDALAMDLFGYDGLQLPTQRPLYGNGAPEPVGSHTAQSAAARYLNARAWTIFGGTDEVQKTIIAKSVLGL